MKKSLFFILDWFLFFTSPGSLKTLNRLCSNNSAFQEDRGVSQGFSAELDVQQSIVQLYLQKVTL